MIAAVLDIPWEEIDSEDEELFNWGFISRKNAIIKPRFFELIWEKTYIQGDGIPETKLVEDAFPQINRDNKTIKLLKI